MSLKYSLTGKSNSPFSLWSVAEQRKWTITKICFKIISNKLVFLTDNLVNLF